MSALRDRLRADELLFGAWKVLGEPVGVEALGQAGFDWIGIDTQHGLFDRSALLPMLQAADAAGIPAIVRVSQNDHAEIGHALDAGAHAVIVPGIETADDARTAVEAFRYPPDGRRSWGPLRPSLRSRPGAAADPGAVGCVLLVESRGGIEQIDEIAAVPGVDALYLGPTDLGLDLGHGTGLEADDARLVSAVDRLRAACRRHGIGMATRCFAPGHLAGVLGAGFTAISVFNELPAMQAAARVSLDAARREAREATATPAGTTHA